MTYRWQDKFRVIPSVYLILINEQDEVLLLRRQNTGYKDDEYGLPAGHVDGKEMLHDAMIREAKEEVGLELQEKDLKLEHTMHRHCGDHERLDFFFTCRKWEGDPVNTEPHKCSELRWSSFDDVPEDTIDYYKQVFYCIKNNQPYSSFGWQEV